MELILQVRVYLGKQISVLGKKANVNMVSFTGEASGKYFNGSVIGTGIDTQKTSKEQGFSLSARYMLEGTDFKNNKCRIFIENNGADLGHCVPYLVTDSEALCYLEKADLRAKVECVEGGVIVRIYNCDGEND